MEQIKLELQSEIPEELKDNDGFINLLKEKLKDYNGYSQECEGTFKIKDGNITDIDITGIALVPRFRDNDKLQPLVMELASQKEKSDFQDTLNTIKRNKKKVETVNQKLSEYMKTIKDFYGEITVKSLKDNYDDSFEFSFYTDKIDDTIINTLEKYHDYEVYDVRCEQYCSLPPIDHKVIILDNRKRKWVITECPTWVVKIK